jgi:hypothetical protein
MCCNMSCCVRALYREHALPSCSSAPTHAASYQSAVSQAGLAGNSSYKKQTCVLAVPVSSSACSLPFCQLLAVQVPLVCHEHLSQVLHTLKVAPASSSSSSSSTGKQMYAACKLHHVTCSMRFQASKLMVHCQWHHCCSAGLRCVQLPAAAVPHMLMFSLNLASTAAATVCTAGAPLQQCTYEIHQ